MLIFLVFILLLNLQLSLPFNSHCISSCVPLSKHPAYKKYLKNPHNETLVAYLSKKSCGYYTEPLIRCTKKDVKEFSTADCMTPNGVPGKCILLNDCANLLNNSVAQSAITFDFTLDSGCGYYTQPLVCCGSHSDYTEAYKENLPDRSTCGNWSNKEYPPWLSLITSKKSECLGALINEEYVLTQYSCIQYFSNLNVYIGECIWSKEQRCTYNVTTIKKFPIYNLPNDGSNDIALIKLDRKVDTNEISPICLYDRSLEVSISVTSSFITKNNTYTYWNDTDITVPQDECEKKFPKAIQREFCTSMEFSKCIFNKIRGAPVQIYDENREGWYLVGLTKNCTQNLMVSDGVSRYFRWIASNIS